MKVPGNLGGPTGADEKCKVLAAAAGVPGATNYRAWISDIDASPVDNFFESTLPYRSTDGKALIATGWTDLISGSLMSPINMTEKKDMLTGGVLECTNTEKLVWTNTT